MSEHELNQIAETVDAIVAKALAMRQSREGELDDLAFQLFEEAGLRRVAVPASAGGSDGEPSYLSVVLRRFGYHAINFGLLEDHLAAELLANAMPQIPEGVLTVASRNELVLRAEGGKVSVAGTSRYVPWSRRASHVLAIATTNDGEALVVLPVGSAVRVEGRNIAGEPRDQLGFDGASPVVHLSDNALIDAFRTRLLLYRSFAMLGAGERALELAISHVTDRTQFGSPLSRRQVVQHYIAEMSGALNATRAASDAALGEVFEVRGRIGLAAALATRIEADRMASIVARLAHQLHGAIGFTEEHSLHLSSKRLTAWRQDDQGEAACAAELARMVPEFGGAWETLIARQLAY